MLAPDSPDSPPVKALEAQQARLAEIINGPAKAIAERYGARLAEMMRPSLNMAMTSVTSILTKRMDDQRQRYVDAVAPSLDRIGAKYSSLPTLDTPSLADSMPPYEGLISDETMERIRSFQDHLRTPDIHVDLVQPASDASIREVVTVLERNPRSLPSRTMNSARSMISRPPSLKKCAPPVPRTR